MSSTGREVRMGGPLPSSRSSPAGKSGAVALRLRQGSAMTVRSASSRSRRRQFQRVLPRSTPLMPSTRALSRAALLAGTSALGLLFAADAAQARPLGGWAPTPSAAALAASQAASQQAQQAAALASNSL